MKRNVKYAIIICAAVLLPMLLCGFSHNNPTQIVLPDLTTLPQIYTISAGLDGDGSEYIDQNPISTENANYENGYDSDSSPIKEVSVDAINSLDVPYLDKNATGYNNADVKGWFYFCGPQSVAGLPISGPLVQCGNNDYYLTHDPYRNGGSYRGSIYVDYRCDLSGINKNRNIVIYAHARGDFGGLKYLDNAKRWWADANNHFIKITTATEFSVWQVFSWYETTADYDYRRTIFLTDDSFTWYANKLQDQNQIPALKKIDFSQDSRILTLSTCKGSNKNVRVAVHAVLVKCEKR